MKIFTPIVSVLLIALFILPPSSTQAQSILNPADPVITYNPASPPTQPATGTIGKWVRTVRVAWSTDNYKCYVYNGFPFRLRFPKSYNPTAVDGKKYPILVFFHGDGEGGPVTDNELSLFHGGQVFDAAVANGSFDGYVLVMQTSNGFWGDPDYGYIKQILDYMVVNNKLDPFRISLNGLSAGGSGVWDFGIEFPQYTAAALPMSSSCLCYDNTAPAALKYTPVWLFQGGLDGSPDPGTTQQLVNAMNSAGGNLTYSLFANDGHDTWDDTWNQSNFWPFINKAYQANPWALGGRTQFCTGDAINITLGLAAGFQAYQWRMNGTVIASATTNTLHVTQLGVYDARVERSGVWSDWSHVPANVSIKAPTVSPNITIPALTSNVIPALDTSKGVTLQVPAGYASYLWQAVNGTTTLSTTQALYTTTPGSYHVKVTEQFGCSSSFGNPYTVIAAGGPSPPSPVSGLTATPLSQTSMRVSWIVSASQSFPQTGFEVYQATSAAGPYSIVGLRNASATSDTIIGLRSGVAYFYKVRAVNGTAAAAASNLASGTTLSDTQPPTAPGNLKVTGTSRNSVGLSWAASTDNVGVTKYDIYVNGVKIGSDTAGTSYTVYDLQYGVTYNFAITARDLAGNISPFSNQVTAQALQTGWTYQYYVFTGTWNALPNLSTLKPVATGFSTSPDLSKRSQDLNFAFLWQGFLHVPVAGTYTFRTNSDDGSALYLGSQGQAGSAYNFPTAPLVNNDGAHAAKDATSAPINLAAGVYPIAIAYYQQGGGFSVTASWSGPQTGAGNFVAIPLSALSDSATGNGQPPATLPAPTGLVAHGGSSASSVTIRWTDNAVNESNYQVYRSVTSNSNYLLAANLPANTISYTDAGLLPGGVYYYKVRAINSAGFSPYSNEDSAHTASQASMPGSLRNIYINFNDGSSAEPAQGAPWNNTNSLPNAGAGIPNLKDDAATGTGFGITLADEWAGANNVGPVTGNNSGVYPDNVEQSLYYDQSGSARHVNITGLSANGKYNLIFYAGRGGVTDNRITHYAVGSQSVQLNAAGNTRQTVALNGLSPNASGKIAIAVTQDAGSPYAYLNAMQIQYNYDTTFYAPTNLVASSPNTTTINLNWVSNAPGVTTGYEIWRSAVPAGPFTLLHAVTGPATGYADAGLSAGSSFFYQVRAVSGTARKSAFSNVAGSYTVAYSIEVQFNDGSQNPAQGGVWNSINTLLYPGYILPDMINTKGQPTGINLGVISNFTGYNIFGDTTGNNSGIYPDNVMKGFYYMNYGDTARMIVTGLNATSTYNFNFFGSRANPTTSVVSTYKIGNTIVTQDATNNTTRTVQIGGVKPDSTGSIVFLVYNSDGGRAYLNALTIDGVPSAFSAIPQTLVATQSVARRLITMRTIRGLFDSVQTSPVTVAQVSAYPNPFVDAVTLSLAMDRPADKLLVRVMDMSGRVVFEQQLTGVPQGISEQRLDMRGAYLPAGSYFIVVEGMPDGKLRAMPVIRKAK